MDSRKHMIYEDRTEKEVVPNMWYSGSGNYHPVWFTRGGQVANSSYRVLSAHFKNNDLLIDIVMDMYSGTGDIILNGNIVIVYKVFD